MSRREMGAREACDARIYTRLCISRASRRAPARRGRRSERAEHSPNRARAPTLTESLLVPRAQVAAVRAKK